MDEAPAMTDGIWSWGWHEDGGQDRLMKAASKNVASSVTPEVSKAHIAGQLACTAFSQLSPLHAGKALCES